MIARCERVDNITYQVMEILQYPIYDILSKDIYINIDYIEVSVGDYLINGKFYHQLDDNTLQTCTEHADPKKLLKSYMGIIQQQKKEIEALKHDVSLYNRYKDITV